MRVRNIVRDFKDQYVAREVIFRVTLDGLPGREKHLDALDCYDYGAYLNANFVCKYL
ncbi:hypothetical protein SMA5143A_6217 [Streptomyces sp. MA5143a]|nr:hypothetical protein SMA5143A_6217 [Streptomyces sp. MA5143a]